MINAHDDGSGTVSSARLFGRFSVPPVVNAPRYVLLPSALNLKIVLLCQPVTSISVPFGSTTVAAPAAVQGGPDGGFGDRQGSFRRALPR